jgi:hypothetical protein
MEPRHFLRSMSPNVQPTRSLSPKKISSLPGNEILFDVQLKKMSSLSGDDIQSLKRSPVYLDTFSAQTGKMFSLQKDVQLNLERMSSLPVEDFQLTCRGFPAVSKEFQFTWK